MHAYFTAFIATELWKLSLCFICLDFAKSLNSEPKWGSTELVLICCTGLTANDMKLHVFDTKHSAIYYELASGKREIPMNI